MRNRLHKIMIDLEEIIKQIEDIENVLNMQYIASCQENNQDWLKSTLNVQIRLLEGIESDSRNLHRKVDETILDVIHNRI